MEVWEQSLFQAPKQQAWNSREELREVGVRETDAPVELQLGQEGFVGVGEEEPGVTRDEAGDVGLGEAEVFEEDEHGVGIRGGLELDFGGHGAGGFGGEAA